MKYLMLFNTIMLLLLMANCKQGKQPAKINYGHLKPGKYSYTAVFDKDNASLNFNMLASGRITGNLVIHFDKAIKTGKSEINTGNITGEFRGDTLFADYVFTSGTNHDVRYQNPLALLHSGDSLTLGSGRTMSYLGRNYLDPATAIQFQKSKFRFKVRNGKQ